jgi:glucosamine--fructose-6-phosphate aminotransferase (isomerizing)
MCGIVGYVGNKMSRDFVLEGLSRLEYRGYDSAGFVCIDEHHKHLSFSKAAGRLSELKKKLQADPYDGAIGMGHTRWATHGGASEENAHPHFDCHKKIAVVHNGIIEGIYELHKKLMLEGHEFSSKTDTEAVAHLFESILHEKNCTIHEAIVKLVSHIKGAYSLVFMLEEYPDQLIVVRHRSPLVIGIGNDEMFIGSDVLVFSDQTNKALFLPDDSFAFIKKDSIELFNFKGKPIHAPVQSTDQHYFNVTKNGFEHFMLKEIYEQKQAIDRTIRFYDGLSTSNPDKDIIWEQLGLTLEHIKNLKSINLIAAGTSWHASRIAQFFFEHTCKIPTRVFLASEFRYMPFFPDDSSLFIFVSQSGETADTLEALRLVSSKGNAPTIALTNVALSTMVREANGFLLMQAGPEISVCSTKAFSCQIASLYWLAHKCAFVRGQVTSHDLQSAHDDLLVAAEILESSIEYYKQTIIETLAKRYSVYDRFIFLGRHLNYPFAMEAALKLKEISYIFAQCYPSGELKHGPIALVDEKTPVVLFSILDDVIYEKILSNAQEVKARKGHLLIFAFEGQKELIALADQVFIIPRVNPLLAPLAMTGLMQFFIYQITKELGLPIDKPRNLAKSVTVE